MKCQLCSNPATVHLTDIVNNQKKELHLCASCAENQQFLKQQDLNLPAILQTLIGQHLGQQTDALSRLTCPACGIKYMEFRAQGRLGCPHDYAVFREGLEPLLVAHSSLQPARGQVAPEPCVSGTTGRAGRAASALTSRHRGRGLRRGGPFTRPAATEGSHG